jgi:DNA-binding transcriptional ArsR family regulator
MTDIKWEILKVLITNKKPMRAHHIAQALDKPQTHIEYHLRQLVDDGIVVCYNDGAKRYAAQLLLTSDKVMDDLKEVLLKATPKLMCYLDLGSTEAEPTTAYVSNLAWWLRKISDDLTKSKKV